MQVERRHDVTTARVIEAATRINAILGTEHAWCYMRLRAVQPGLALRAIAADGKHRHGDQEVARLASLDRSLYWQSQCESMENVAHDDTSRRRDTITALVADRATELGMQEQWTEAEQLLEEYGLDTAGMRRLLFDPDRRRPALWETAEDNPEPRGSRKGTRKSPLRET